MKALFYDVFKNDKSILDAPPELLALENKYAWTATKDEDADRFFPIVFDDNELPRGAVIHLGGYETTEQVAQHVDNVPWLTHGFSDGLFYVYGNFKSVELLFKHNGKYAYENLNPMNRVQPFTTDPTVTWYVVVEAKEPSTYDAKHGVGDAVGCFRLLKGGIAEEVYDIEDSKKGKILRIKANSRGEVEQYVRELSSAQSADAAVTILRTKSTSVWDFCFF